MDNLQERLTTFLHPYLSTKPVDGRPLTIATWAQSLDAKIAPADRRPIALSSLETKFMTHLIRRGTDAILIGAETAVTDNPSLNGMTLDDVTYRSTDTGEWVGWSVEGGEDGRAAETSDFGSPSTGSPSEITTPCINQ
jgi:hypothetical protein